MYIYMPGGVFAACRSRVWAPTQFFMLKTAASDDVLVPYPTVTIFFFFLRVGGTYDASLFVTL